MSDLHWEIESLFTLLHFQMHEYGLKFKRILEYVQYEICKLIARKIIIIRTTEIGDTMYL